MTDAFIIIALLATVVVQLTVLVVNIRAIKHLMSVWNDRLP